MKILEYIAQDDSVIIHIKYPIILVLLLCCAAVKNLQINYCWKFIEIKIKKRKRKEYEISIYMIPMYPYPWNLEEFFFLLLTYLAVQPSAALTACLPASGWRGSLLQRASGEGKRQERRRKSSRIASIK